MTKDDKLVEFLHDLDALMAEWLTDNTVEVFEEQPQIDYLRSQVNELLTEV